MRYENQDRKFVVGVNYQLKILILDTEILIQK